MFTSPLSIGGKSSSDLSGFACFHAAFTRALTADKSALGMITLLPRNPFPKAATAAPTIPASGFPPGVLVKRNFQ